MSLVYNCTCMLDCLDAAATVPASDPPFSPSRPWLLHHSIRPTLFFSHPNNLKIKSNMIFKSRISFSEAVTIISCTEHIANDEALQVAVASRHFRPCSTRHVWYHDWTSTLTGSMVAENQLSGHMMPLTTRRLVYCTRSICQSRTALHLSFFFFGLLPSLFTGDPPYKSCFCN